MPESSVLNEILCCYMLLESKVPSSAWSLGVAVGLQWAPLLEGTRGCQAALLGHSAPGMGRVISATYLCVCLGALTCWGAGEATTGVQVPSSRAS